VQSCASGAIRRTGGDIRRERFSIEEIRNRCDAEITGDQHYETLEKVGLQYGSSFRRVAHVWRRDSQAVARLHLSQTVDTTVLDAAFQIVAEAVPRDEAHADAYLPVSLERFCDHTRLTDKTHAELWAHAVLRPGATTDDAFVSDIYLLDGSGEVLIEANGLRVQRLSTTKKDELSDWLYEIQWQPKVLSADALLQSGHCLLFDDREEFARPLAQLLEARGVTASLGDTQCLSDAAALKKICGQTLPDEIVYFAREDTAPMDSCSGVLHLVQAMVTMEWHKRPRLFIVTRGAQLPDAPGFAQAPLWGLGRVIALEHPDLRCTLIDLGGASDLDALSIELPADDAEDQISFREGKRYVARIARYGREDKPSTFSAAPGQAYRLELTTPGILENLVLRATSRSAPAPGEVEIEVRAAGLNFNDVMKAIGVYPGLDGGPIPLGNECSGKIVAIGTGVDGWTVGTKLLRSHLIVLALT
jgi:hypothetical protein